MYLWYNLLKLINFRSLTVKQLTAIMVGAGARGTYNHAPYAHAHPNELQFVGVAEPVQSRREEFIRLHPAAAAHAYSSWEKLLNREKLADIVFVCSQDKQHAGPAKLALEKGYDLFLEKPISPDIKECLELQALAQKHNNSTAIGHVLRYTTFFQGIKKIIERGDLGQIMSIQHNENVGHIHMSHSYVRGHWRKTADSSPMILAKSCHDLDIIQWLVGKKCQKLSSFGSLSYFHKGNAPKAAPKNCLEGCELSSSCPYYAPKIYLNDEMIWSRAIQIHQLSPQERHQFLASSNYGACVFHSDNDVVDHQVVNFEFEEGITGVFTMSGFTSESTAGRTLKIMGSKAELQGHLEKGELNIYYFEDDRVETVQFP